MNKSAIFELLALCLEYLHVSRNYLPAQIIRHCRDVMMIMKMVRIVGIFKKYCIYPKGQCDTFPYQKRKGAKIKRCLHSRGWLLKCFCFPQITLDSSPERKVKKQHGWIHGSQRARSLHKSTPPPAPGAASSGPCVTSKHAAAAPLGLGVYLSTSRRRPCEKPCDPPECGAPCAPRHVDPWCESIAQKHLVVKQMEGTNWSLLIRTFTTTSHIINW